MAPVSLLYLGFVLSSLHSSNAQTITGTSSSITPLNLPINAAPPPTKQTDSFGSSFPPRGRSDVPIRATVWDRLTNTVPQGRRMTRPTAQSVPSLISALSTKNLSSGPILTQPPASRPRTDTDSLVSRAFGQRDVTTKGLTTTLPTAATEPADSEPVTTTTSVPEEEALNESEVGDSQGLGSGSNPTVMLVVKESPVPLPTVGDEMAQYQPQAQTAVSEVKVPPSDSHSVNPPLFALTEASKTSATAQSDTLTTDVPVVTQATPGNEVLTGELTANTPPTDRSPPELDSAAVTTTATNGSSHKQPQSSGLPVSAQTQKSPHSNTTTPQATTTSTRTSVLTTTEEAVRRSSKASDNAPNKTATQLGKNTANPTVQSSKTGTTSFLTTGVVPVTRLRVSTTYQSGIVERNRSILLGHPHQAPHSTSNPAPSPSNSPSPNGTFLSWGDLSRTLAFAWELHVFGSASLFLLLFAGAALGLTLSPGINCPHRGALALANALLFLAGGLRAALFLIDPYGTRRLLPRPAIMALYNLPLHLLVWTHAALALLALRVAGTSVLPSNMERPPLVAVLAVLQCTLLLAADLLSPALSPVVPVTLQVLSVCWGLALCLGFLFHVFPRIRCPPVPQPGVPEGGGRKAWTGNKRIGVILGRVLAVCAVLGTICCGLHVYAILWLYGLLGDWTHFSWGWWLVHFWARLLELSWGFSLLLLGSWVFWRPQGCQGREEGAADGRASGDLPSPGQSTGSTQRHTCWSKIVQSLKGKPCKKSDSNGVGGGGGGPGEVPNNWAGQERPGADISKSLIRNQNHEQASVQPRYIKDINSGRNFRGQSAERGVSDGSTGSLLRLQALGRPPQRSASGSLDHERDTSLSLCEFDLRPPSPIDLTRSIDEALHREHLLEGVSLFHPLNQNSQYPSQGSGVSQGPWLRRNSDPQLSESSEAPTESSMPLGGSILSSVPSRQVTAPPTPSHQGHRWAGNGVGNVPSSVSCPVSLRPSRISTGNLEDEGVDDTRPFITPDSERMRGRRTRPAGSRSYLEVGRHDDSASVSSEIIDL
ncbi:proline-rich transmembrane protein 3 isoform X1 [Solea solea]|uniref:proline-rich transmembrane protein 3 isoform X1 n=1 Tax=Solea solea TaxID=90069 RepID=UPI00272BEF4C|nr:proline-rich transmembrane protein 3 isoform X1 [Solea solea]XP_058498471.1 proline-rich transmembrane protein 3 isoform X1 [Solea solea]